MWIWRTRNQLTHHTVSLVRICILDVLILYSVTLATTRHQSPVPNTDSNHNERGPPPIARHSVAPLYSRAALPVDGGDQVLVPNMLPSVFPPLPHLHSSQPGIPVAGPGAVTSSLAIAGYQHHHSSDPSLATSRLAIGGDGLPDIVHSHNIGHALQPRPNQHRSGTSAGAPVSRHQRQRQQQSRNGHGRSRGNRDRTSRSAQHRRRGQTQSTSSSEVDSGRCKEPCMKCMVVVTSLRWVLLGLSILGILFVVSGIIMAALHAVGNDFLIYALVFIGLGVVVVAVVVVAWKGTPPGSEPIHALFNIGNTGNTRREHRPRRTRRARDGQWHGGVLYPEFQYRRPPPSYAASMQAYQVQLFDAQSNNNTITLGNNNDNYSLPGSPPPSYRSRASTIHSGVHITFPPGRDSAPNSRPPTYRSRTDSHQRPRLPLEDLDTSSPNSAPADVSFTGPMTADTVQNIIGTASRRQPSIGSDVWHSRSASMDMAQNSEISCQELGSSLENGSANGTNSNSLNSQENQTLSSQSGDDVLHSEVTSGSNSEDTLHQSAAALAQCNPELTKEDEESTTDFSPTSFNSTSTEWEEVRGAVDSVTLTTNTIEGQDSEPEQYNTSM